GTGFSLTQRTSDLGLTDPFPGLHQFYTTPECNGTCRSEGEFATVRNSRNNRQSSTVYTCQFTFYKPLILTDFRRGPWSARSTGISRSRSAPAIPAAWRPRPLR